MFFYVAELDKHVLLFFATSCICISSNFVLLLINHPSTYLFICLVSERITYTEYENVSQNARLDNNNFV